MGKKMPEESPEQSEEETSEEESEEEEEMKVVEVEVETTSMDDFCKAIEKKDLRPHQNPSVIYMPAESSPSCIITAPGGRSFSVVNPGTPSVLPNAAAEDNFRGMPVDFLSDRVDPSTLPKLVGVKDDEMAKVIEGLAKRKMAQLTGVKRYPESVHPKRRGRPPKDASNAPKSVEHLLPKKPVGVEVIRPDQEKEGGRESSISSPWPGDNKETMSSNNDESDREQTTDASATKSALPGPSVVTSKVESLFVHNYTKKRKSKSKRSGSAYCSAPNCHNSREKCLGKKPFYR